MPGIDPFRDPEAAFAAAVRDGRDNLRLTQEQVRRRLLDNFGIDLSKTAMSRLEKGERPIRFNEVAALAQILKIDVFANGRRQSQAEELDVSLMQANERLRAIETELAVASTAMAAAAQAAQAAEERLLMLKGRQAELRNIRDQLTHGLADAADARMLLQMRIGKSNGEH